MATWRDGPEYAPADPPELFTAPDDAVALSVAPLREPAPPTPAMAPTDFAQPGQPTVSLETVVPYQKEDRNPVLPFAVASSALTETTSAWEAAHAAAKPAQQPTRDPYAPLAVRSSVPADYEPKEPVGPPQSLPARMAWHLTWPLVVSLACGLVPVMSPIMLAASAILAQRVRQPMARLRGAAIGGLVFVMLLCLMALFTTYDWWGLTGRWSVLVTALLMSYAGLLSYQQARSTPPTPR